MPPPERTEASRLKVYDAIEAYCIAHPDMRVGQVIANALYNGDLVYKTRGRTVADRIFYVEDTTLAEIIRASIS